MTLNFTELSALNDTMTELQDSKLPFKLSLALDENGQFIQEREGVFRIKDGMEEECRKAREDLNAFTCEVDLRKLPMSALENLEFTPKQLAALEKIIDEEA